MGIGGGRHDGVVVVGGVHSGGVVLVGVGGDEESLEIFFSHLAGIILN